MSFYLSYSLIDIIRVIESAPVHTIPKPIVKDYADFGYEIVGLVKVSIYIHKHKYDVSSHTIGNIFGKVGRQGIVYSTNKLSELAKYVDIDTSGTMYNDLGPFYNLFVLDYNAVYPPGWYTFDSLYNKISGVTFNGLNLYDITSALRCCKCGNRILNYSLCVSSTMEVMHTNCVMLHMLLKGQPHNEYWKHKGLDKYTINFNTRNPLYEVTTLHRSKNRTSQVSNHPINILYRNPARMDMIVYVEKTR